MPDSEHSACGRGYDMPFVSVDKSVHYLPDSEHSAGGRGYGSHQRDRHFRVNRGHQDQRWPKQESKKTKVRVI